MKQVIILSVLSVILIVSCKKRDVAPGIETVTVVVSASFMDPFNNVVATGVEVKAINVQTGIEKTGSTNNEGRVVFSGLTPGIYDFRMSMTVTPAKYQELFKTSSNADVIFNASSLNQAVNNASGQVQVLKLQEATVSALVIKQIYYAGSHTADGASFRDEFVEVFNNSPETVYLDGLFLSLLWGKNNSTVFAYTLPDGQFDWNKSYNMPTGTDANTSALYSKVTYQFPGTGKQYPLLPGKSAVIAQNAVNHTANYIRPDGKPVTINKPELTVDLSNASFETTHNEGYVFDVTNAAVPDMITIYSTINDMVFTPTHEAVVLYRETTKDKVKNAPSYPTPNVTTPDATTKYYQQIPLANVEILDAVEIQQSPTKQVPRKLQSRFENSFTYVPGGGYSSQSVIRKVARTFGERKVLQDSNNSLEDFIYLNKANPFGW